MSDKNVSIDDTKKDVNISSVESEENVQEQGNKRRRKRKRSKKVSTDEDPENDDRNKKLNLAGHSDDGESAVDTSTINKVLEVDRTIYVEGIPFTVTPADVRKFFEDHKKVVDLRLPVWNDSGRLKGYGHVVFESEKDVAFVLTELNGKYLNGRYLSLQKAKKPRDDDLSYDAASVRNSTPSTTIMVQNLSYEASEEDVEAVMKQFGEIDGKGGVRVVRHSDTQRSKGFAYVQFENLDSAINAMKASGTISIRNRKCRFDYDHGRIKGSFRTADRQLWSKVYNNPPDTTGTSSGQKQK